MTGKRRQRETPLAPGTTWQDEIKVMNDGAKKFGALLRRHRGAAGMTQEALAGRSGLSVRTVRGLERGEGHGPRPDTLSYLVGALGLSGSERQLFEEAALRLGAQPAVDLGVPDTAPRLGAQEYPTVPLTTLIGREDLVREAGALLLRDDVRLLTLVGPGGVGKTRVGLEVSENLRAGYADGGISVGLETVNDPDLVLPTIAGALGLREDAGGRSLLARLQGYLHDKETLLLLDNFE
ncbi:MAG TPA: helix-turn-helix domain-containing protein, partial [Rubrobacteraceae bacterium]|nr:helix-turn-helix domain-containing protein [Rubrobacteraceae bacterium]